MKRSEHHYVLSRQAIVALAAVILASVLGIIVLSLWGLSLRFGVVGQGGDVVGGTADEALSILGNVAAAAVGGLVGWLTRDLVVARNASEEDDDA